MADSRSLAVRCARLLDEKKLESIEIFDVSRAVQITDCFVVATGLNHRHLEAACDHLIRELRREGLERRGREGYRTSGWVLVDFIDVVVHLFLADQRRYYDLELLWGDAPRVDWAEDSTSAMTEGASAVADG